jgi:Methyltransferase domain
MSSIGVEDSGVRRQKRSCPVCRDSRAEPLQELADHITGDQFLAVTCTSCGLVYLADPPPPAQIGGYYANELGRGMRRHPGRIFSALRTRLIRKDLEKLMPHVAASSLIVDLGTGDGSVAVTLDRLGYRVVACDLAPAEEWPHRGIPYVELEPGWEFGEVVEATGTPSALVLRHVLEHVHAPRRLLERARATGVRVIDVTVPNFDSRLRPRLGQSWIHWDPPRHMTYFSPGTLRALAAYTGYQVAHLETYGIDELVTSSYRALELKALGREDRRAHYLRRVARVLEPKSVLSGVGSAVANPISNCVIRCILTQEARTEPRA